MLSAADLLAPIGFDMFRKRSASGNVHELDPSLSITLSPRVIASSERGTGGKFLPPARGGFTARFVEALGRLFLDSISESLLALELAAGRGSLFSPALEIRQEEFMIIAKLGMKLTPFGARAKGAGDWFLKS